MKRDDDQLPLRDTPAPRKPNAPMYSASHYGELPKPPTAADLHGAKVYLAAVRDLLAFDLTLARHHRMTRAARVTLQRIERRWAARAAGKDPRWNEVGARAGRLTAAEKERVAGGPTAWDQSDKSGT